MENQTNKIFTLDDGEKHIVMRQISYNGSTYFITGLLTEDEKDVTDKISLLQEVKKDDRTFVKTVKDPEIIKVIFQHISKTED